MRAKQIFDVGVGFVGAAVVGVTIAATTPVAFGTAEFSSQGAGAAAVAGGFSGILGMLYSAFALLKQLASAVSGDASNTNDQVVKGGLSILQSLTSGSTDAIGLTKHAAIAVLFADRAYAQDPEGMNMVTDLSKRVFEPLKKAV